MIKKLHNQNDDGSDQNRNYSDIGNYLGLGLQLAVTVVVMVFLGIWLDGKFNSNPWMTILCSFLGIFSAIYSFIKTVLKSGK